MLAHAGTRVQQFSINSHTSHLLASYRQYGVTWMVGRGQAPGSAPVSCWQLTQCNTTYALLLVSLPLHPLCLQIITYIRSAAQSHALRNPLRSSGTITSSSSSVSSTSAAPVCLGSSPTAGMTRLVSSFGDDQSVPVRLPFAFTYLGEQAAYEILPTEPGHMRTDWQTDVWDVHMLQGARHAWHVSTSRRCCLLLVLCVVSSCCGAVRVKMRTCQECAACQNDPGNHAPHMTHLSCLMKS
jgi:hypothetical protein